MFEVQGLNTKPSDLPEPQSQEEPQTLDPDSLFASFSRVLGDSFSYLGVQEECTGLRFTCLGLRALGLRHFGFGSRFRVQHVGCKVQGYLEACRALNPKPYIP